jgi:MarR family transcriptional regulator, transcriptional regulator for hemolysin
MRQDPTRENSIGYLIHEVARLMRRRFEDEASVHGFTLPQWRALAEIYRNEGISQVALASCIDTDQMTVSGIVSRLEKRGLIDRYADPNDSRAKLARLTPAGLELVTRAKNVGRALYENALTGISATERDLLTAGLKRIRDNLNEMTAAEKEAV